jgi:hypothetical protein
MTLPIDGCQANQLFTLLFSLYLVHEQSGVVSFFGERNRAGNRTYGQNVLSDLDWDAAA